MESSPGCFEDFFQITYLVTSHLNSLADGVGGHNKCLFWMSFFIKEKKIYKKHLSIQSAEIWWWIASDKVCLVMFHDGWCLYKISDYQFVICHYGHPTETILVCGGKQQQPLWSRHFGHSSLGTVVIELAFWKYSRLMMSQSV